MATGITWATAGCQAGISAKPSSTTQSNWMPGMARAASVSAGRVWITSPSEEVLISSTRKLLHLGGVGHQAAQRLDHRARLELAQAVVVAIAAGALEAGAAVQAQAHDLHQVGERRGELRRGGAVYRHQRAVERGGHVHQAGIVADHG